MIYATLSMDGGLDERRAAVDDLARRAGGTATWRSSESLERSYALLELPEGYDAATIAAASGGAIYDKPVIALALFPAVPEALPPLVEALGAAGRPAGILACIARGGAAIVEWDPAVTETGVVMSLVDLELARFQSGRTAELLSPIPPSTVAAIAAAGLQAPQIGAGRVLELRIDRD